ncbi:hypothetical protein [Telmatospirillum sp.]|uniref:IS66 family transposase n=1 Tax=Telmatospirillum sp. TaxID=2079197 RepID=UPI00284F78FC|nr:hypothetical protein [Telmatospirillum sp.]MDR3440617.1 hypothetical protein [Telmatospirillum sp.]
MAEAELATAKAQQSDDRVMIAHLKLMIEKLKRNIFGPRAERTARLLDQFELQLEDLERFDTQRLRHRGGRHALLRRRRRGLPGFRHAGPGRNGSSRLERHRL